MAAASTPASSYILPAICNPTGKPARVFREFKWTTRTSWSRERRVVAKAEFSNGEANPRFVVTSLKRAECKAKYLYEKVYCARGDMENRIKILWGSWTATSALARV